MRLKILMRNVNVANALLLLILVGLAVNVLPPLFHLQVTYTLPSSKKPVKQQQEQAEAKPLSLSEYAVISEENIFHPERKIPIIKPEAPPLPKPDFVLYGTLITDDTSLAYLVDQKSGATSSGGGKRQKALRKGETISGFTLKEIEADKVLMVRGEERIEVRITDKARSKGTSASTPSSTTVQGSPAPSVSGKTRPSVQPVAPQPDDMKKRRDAIRGKTEKR